MGVVAYLNAEPLVYGLDRERPFRLERDTPARVAERLHQGEIDLGLIPSIEYAAGDYAIVPGCAVASRGAVRSVCLFHRVPLDGVRRVAVDASSRTSVALLKILLRERLGRDPEYVTQTPRVDDMLASADAALVIGDTALYSDVEAERLDLGTEWAALTGLPFVYAFWAGRPGAVGAQQVAVLQNAAAAGVRSLAQVAASYNGRRELNEAYLRSNIVYSLGESERTGLAEFYRRARAAGLLAHVPELKFYAHS